MRVWSHAREFDASKGSVGVWVLSIARNMAIDHVRSAQARFATRLRPLDLAERAQFGTGAGGPEKTIDEARTIKAAFSHLSLNQKRVLELAYYEGCSQSEIANRLNARLGTVKRWMRSAFVPLPSAIKESAVV